jgi:hypothetical protein
MGQLRNVMPQRFTVGNTCLGWSKILKLFLERGKEDKVKKKKAGKNAEKNAENNGNETSGLLKK